MAQSRQVHDKEQVLLRVVLAGSLHQRITSYSGGFSIFCIESAPSASQSSGMCMISMIVIVIVREREDERARVRGVE
jgi:hypothetical protein